MDIFRQGMFETVDKEAAEIRKKIEGGMYYGIPISEYPKQDNVQLVIAYHLYSIESLSKKVTGREAV